MKPLILATLLTATTAHADIAVSFADGAPKDRFTITNTGPCAIGTFGLTIDLITASAGLIFDVTDAGAGVEVFQPFEITSGGDYVMSASEVADGDQILTLLLSDFDVQAEVTFTIDLDDTGGGREITVSGSEIAGALVLVTTDTEALEAAFDDQGVARIVTQSCTS